MKHTIYIIHEHLAWIQPLFDMFDEQGVPYEDRNMSTLTLDLSQTPPEGIYYNRMSASSHTRDHTYAAESTKLVLKWLALHGRTIVNGPQALALEISKVEQYLGLSQHGLQYPKTIASTGSTDDILGHIQTLGSQAILKPNRGGKGTGVHIIHTLQKATSLLESDTYTLSPDGITLIQQYIQPPTGYVYRLEFVGGVYMYTVQIDTRDGLDLCPADACNIGKRGDTCQIQSSQKFTIVDTPVSNHIISKCEVYLSHHDIQIGAMECVIDTDGSIYFYDINTNTNYNSQAESKYIGAGGMKSIAKYLIGLRNK